MTDDRFNPRQLLVLRKLTRAAADALREDARGVVATLTPLLRPRVALGDPADGGTREPFHSADNTFRELQSLYESVAPAAPFNLHKDLKPPVDLSTTSLELSPLDYAYTAKSAGTAKPLRITSPLKWALGYAGFTPGTLGHAAYTPRRLRELLGGPSRSVNDLRQFVLHALALHLSIARQAGVARILDALHYRIGSDRLEEFGPLPVPVIAFAVPTLRPPDDVLIEHTEIAGTDAFEEVIDPAGIAALRDPVREKLAHLAKSHGVDVPGT